MERRAREKEALRLRILETASKLFIEEGFENVSIRKIAERIEYSPATIYLYFKDKAELIGAICENTFNELLQAVNASKLEKDPIAGLRRGLKAYIEFGVAHPHHYLVIFGANPPKEQMGPVCDPNQSPQIGLRAYNVLRKAVEECMTAGAIPHGDVETTSQALWMAVHGVTSLLITNYEDSTVYFPWLPKQHLIDSSLDLLMTGIQHLALPSPRL